MTGDAYGQLILDYFRGKKPLEIVERDDGYIDPSEAAPRLYFLDYKNWPQHEKKAIKYARGRILDIGCGAGRHSLYLQRNGFDVLGIDNSPGAIRVAKLRGLRKAKVMSIMQISKKLGIFDTLLMLGNNFGLFGSRARAKLLLRRFHKLTSPNARIIAESLDPYKTKDPDHLAYHKFNRERGRMPGQVRLRIRYRRTVGPWFDYLLVSQAEMRAILAGTGWRAKKFIKSRGARYIAIIEKSGGRGRIFTPSF